MACSLKDRAIPRPRAILACLIFACAVSTFALADEYGGDGGWSEAEELPPVESSLSLDDGPDDSQFMHRDAAKFDEWEPIVPAPEEHGIGDDNAEKPPLRPFDWMHHWGMRHSSRDGRFADKSVPMAYGSWLNRPYHVDWYAGPLLGDDQTAVASQKNAVVGGIRAGWDFDYYWGIEGRLGWADPQISSDFSSQDVNGSYVAGDVDLLYYPWGDTKVRPFFQLGLGVAEIGAIGENGVYRDVNLLTMPFGLGVQFPQTRWLAWRLEIIDNLAFGADDVDTMHNVAFTAGMEWRFGARPNSYWPWRSSRTIW